MRFAASISASADVKDALDELLEPIDKRVTPGMVDIAFLFATSDYDDELSVVVEEINKTFPNALLIGCTAEGTIGADQELERVPSMSLLVGSLPDARICPFHLHQSDLESASSPDDWERLVGVSPESGPTFFAIGDPFKISVQGFIDKVNESYSQAPLIGGVASAAFAPGENCLILGDEIHHEGIVGVALTGRLVVDTVVSQGCRPIGKPFVITKAEKNLIHELGGRSAWEQLKGVLGDLPEEDEELARESLLIGRVIDEYKGDFTRGDFLVHNIIGVDQSSGTIGIAAHARAGTTMQFHVRDADTADEDLRAMLELHRGTKVESVLLFGCNGRGTHMWPYAGHDVGVIREILGKDVPVAGFFCGGEFGPIGGRNFVHGYTASMALFREAPTT